MKKKILFVMEQPLGNRTYYQNLRKYIDHCDQIDAQWIEVDYCTRKNLNPLIKLLPGFLQASITGRRQVHEGYRLEGIDGVFFHTQSAAALAGMNLFKLPYVISTDMTPIQQDRTYKKFENQSSVRVFAKKLRLLQYPKIIKKASFLIPWTNWAKTSLIEDYSVPSEMIEVIAPGVDLELWSPKERYLNAVIRVMFVGNDYYRKGGDILLKAFQNLRKHNVELFLVTSNYVESEPGVKIYNQLRANSPELIELYKSCDIFVLPSRAEAFGIVGVEACATGLPIIVSNAGGITDIVLDGQNGFIIPPGDAESLQEKLELLISDQDLRKRLGKESRQLAEKHFNAKVNANKIIKIVSEMN